MRTHLISPLTLLLIAAPAALPAQTAASAAIAVASPILAYQGQLTQTGAAVTGPRNFQFSILSSAGAALWTSGMLPVTVTNGIYAVELGGTGMPAIPQSVLSQYNLVLQISVGLSSASTSLSLLSPNVPLVPALQASAAAQLTGSFSGDLGGTQNAIQLLKLQGYPLDLTTVAPAAGQVLAFTGTRWVAGTVLGTAGPQGPAGPQGAAGTPGSKGPVGPQGLPGAGGAAGAAGRTLWNGTGAPQAGLGAVGDFYLDTTLTQVYGPKGSAGWPAAGAELIGPAGPAGTTGAAGPAGAAGPQGPQGPQGGQGLQGLQGVPGPVGAAGAQGVAGTPGAGGAPGASGATGGNGSTVLNGPGNPSLAPNNDPGVDGDFYVDTVNQVLYGPRAGGAWPAQPLFSMAGPQGAQGAQGAPGAAGSMGPQGVQGAAGAAGLQGVQGPAGATGAIGATGASGADGETVLSGPGNPGQAPNNNPGVDGDFYLDTVNQVIYGPRAGGAWPGSPLFSLVGPQGPQGAQGAAGSAGGMGLQGVQGPAGAAGLQGAQGPAGATGAIGATGAGGANGNTVQSGPGNPGQAPNNNPGVDGDFYLDTVNQVIYGPRAGGAWPGSPLFSLVGPQGPQGSQGAAGSAGTMGLQGAQGPAGSAGLQGVPGSPGAAGAAGATGAPGSNGNTLWSGSGNPNLAPNNNPGVTGDFYLDDASELFYGPKAGGTWGAGTLLAGAAGAPGAQGAQGPAGAAGLQGVPGSPGATGATGATGASGANGNTVLGGSVAPVASQGNNGDYYLDHVHDVLYGPKSSGAWPAGTSLAGAAGPQGSPGIQGSAGAAGAQGSPGAVGATGATGVTGTPGANGNTVWNGSGTPAASLGANGDFYIQAVPGDPVLLGPKQGSWPSSGVSLVGPAGLQGGQGPQGSQGPQGPQGSAGPAGPTGSQGTAGSMGPRGIAGGNGNTIWNGSGAPPSSTGAAGDFYLDTNATAFYGPKTVSWPASGTSLLGAAGAAGAAENYQQIAAAQYSIPTNGNPFNAGSGPAAVAYDGANIWTAGSDGYVRSFNTVDGVTMATYDLGVPCLNMVTDGNSVWVVTALSLFKLSASTGAVLWQASHVGLAGASWVGMAYDGTYIWVAMPDSGAYELFLAAATSAPTPLYNISNAYYSVACTGSAVYLGGNGGLSQFSVGSTPGLVKTIPASSGNHYGVAYDGTCIWMTNHDANTVTKYQLSPLQAVASYSTGMGPWGIAFDGVTMWVTNNTDGTVTGIRVADGVNMGTLTAGSQPEGIAFDGLGIWVGNAGASGNGSLVKF